MTDKIESTQQQPLTCPGCGGSGQTSFFGGASRFMLTWEDCPDCCGTGIVLEKTDSDLSKQKKIDDDQ